MLRKSCFCLNICLLHFFSFFLSNLAGCSDLGGLLFLLNLKPLYLKVHPTIQEILVVPRWDCEWCKSTIAFSAIHIVICPWLLETVPDWWMRVILNMYWAISCSILSTFAQSILCCFSNLFLLFMLSLLAYFIRILMQKWFGSWLGKIILIHY